MSKDLVIGFGIGLLSGVVIGGVIALLYAPKTGQETRQLIKDKATEVVDAVKEKASGVMDTAKETASEASRKGQVVVNALKS
ncbi:MAG TPA: YtxH domain-containing protein [Dehalococcoidales bacterium]